MPPMTSMVASNTPSERGGRTCGNYWSIAESGGGLSLEDMRKEYDLSKLKGGVRGKYLCQAAAGTNLVLIDSDLAGMFPDSESVNRALRVLAEASQTKSVSKPRDSE
jgi:hypothetical protein